MINKIVDGLDAAVADIPDGAVLMVGGFGGAGLPFELVDALVRQGARGLTIISNNAGSLGKGLSKLVAAGQVRKFVCSFPRQPGSNAFDDLYREGKLELELVPQGTLAERIRAGGAGIGGFFTPTGVGTELAQGKESRVIDGVEHILEYSLRADYALIKGDTGDRWGNLTYRRSGRNFGPVMAAAARCTIAQVSHIVDLGGLDPEHIITPGVYVQRVVLAGAN
ncbi:3-oxoacid CoA-transferase subunit A [Bordetella sp. N]|uniref:3-oxoacid CoA-transferase subunit A n=1 Tax=Bordetella sp. N TaxID=1746199 RepID=UPI00070DC166|nr:3-oxoacid CoA-transferase subunit A [Bordetella sp. N]ALM82920.1 3-oxoadipate CoA-transferase [Bordetella sp. N]